MTYKYAIKVICDCFKEYGFYLTKTAQKQAGYITLFATEGEFSKQLNHDVRIILKNLPCAFEPGSMTDEAFESFLERYAKLLHKENPEGGEISLGWIVTELQEQEIWQVFSGSEI